MRWQTKKDRLSLLKNLVNIPSISRSVEEREFPDYLHKEAMELDYFKKNPGHVKSHHFNDGSSFFSALVKNGDVKKTIILISHYDVVGVDDFGSQKNIAFDVDKMTEFYKENKNLLPEHAQKEISIGDWIFGRGSMDMKAGLTVEMSLLEKASNGSFDGNILLIAVSDEEVSSRGMLHAVEEIKRLKEKHELEYILCLNTEPSFKENPYDQNKYLYTGTIGKTMPTFYFRGQETHVGEPFAGLNASFMCSMLTNEFELCSDFQETVEGEKTPVLTNLMVRDLKPFYNVQTPISSVSMFNLLYMEESLESITKKLLSKTKDIATSILNTYKERAKRANVSGIPFEIRILTWQELYKEAADQVGKKELNNLIHGWNISLSNLDEREKSLKTVEKTSELISDRSPMIVFYYSPPFYPAVSSRNNELVKELSTFVESYSKEKHNVELQRRCFFQGLCDLSYASIDDKKTEALTDNMPLFNKGYDIPFETIKTFDFPVMNLGPYGSDPHQKTERLEVEFSFGVLPDMLEELLKKAFENKKQKHLKL